LGELAADEVAELKAAGIDDAGVEWDRLVTLGESMERELTEPWGPYEEYAIMMRDPTGTSSACRRPAALT